MFGAFFRAVATGLRAAARALSRRSGKDVLEEEEMQPDKYVWHRYLTDLCGACRSKEGRASVLVYPDGRIDGNPRNIPPQHPNCDCAMQNQRTGGFAFNVAGGP